MPTVLHAVSTVPQARIEAGEPAPERKTSAKPQVVGGGGTIAQQPVGRSLLGEVAKLGLVDGLRAPAAGRQVRVAGLGDDILKGITLPPGYDTPPAGPTVVAPVIAKPADGRTAQERLVDALQVQGFKAQPLSDGAVRLRGRVQGFGEPVNFIVPRTFEPRPEGKVDVNLHVHGWTNSATVFENLDFGRLTKGNRGVTVVPEISDRATALKAWTQYHDAGLSKGRPSFYYTSEGFTSFMDRVMTKFTDAGVAQVPEGQRPVSALGTFSLTGHSGAYDALGRVLGTRSDDQYVKAVRGVGLFDATYGELDALSRTASRLRDSGGVFMAVGVEGHDTGNNMATVALGIRGAPDVQSLDRGQRPRFTGNIYLANQKNRGNYAYYVSAQHYDVQREHMPDFFAQLRARWP